MKKRLRLLLTWSNSKLHAGSAESINLRRVRPEKSLFFLELAVHSVSEKGSLKYFLKSSKGRSIMNATSASNTKAHRKAIASRNIAGTDATKTKVKTRSVEP